MTDRLDKKLLAWLHGRHQNPQELIQQAYDTVRHLYSENEISVNMIVQLKRHLEVFMNSNARLKQQNEALRQALMLEPAQVTKADLKWAENAFKEIE